MSASVSRSEKYLVYEVPSDDNLSRVIVGRGLVQSREGMANASVIARYPYSEHHGNVYGAEKSNQVSLQRLLFSLLAVRIDD